MNNVKIAIIEDDAILREELSQFLQSHGFIIFEVNNGISLLEILSEDQIDVIVLDLNLPGQSGLEIAKSVRRTYPNIGVVMLTARTALADRIKGYESGADIFLPKPTPPQELLVAIKNLARRINQARPEGWILSVQAGKLIHPGGVNAITLLAIECFLLNALACAPNRVLETETICELLSEKVGGEAITKRSLENTISRLRKKIQPLLEGDERRIIHSVWGSGYKLYLPLAILDN